MYPATRGITNMYPVKTFESTLGAMNADEKVGEERFL